MREAPYIFGKIYNFEQVKEINNVIKENFIEGEDNYARGAEKTSDVKFVRFGQIQRLMGPFLDFCYTSNINYFGFDLHPITSQKRLNYNIFLRCSFYMGVFFLSTRLFLVFFFLIFLVFLNGFFCYSY